MSSKKAGVLDPVAFLQTFVVQSIRSAGQKGCSACDDDFNYIESIGLTASRCLEDQARQQLGLTGPLTADAYAEVVVHLKNKIGGGFSRKSGRQGVIHVENTRCPFGDRVKDAPELCRMTSSVFGGIAARNFGYAKVELRQRIAAGADRCEVCIYTDPDLADSVAGYEYVHNEGSLKAQANGEKVSVRVAEKIGQTWCQTTETGPGSRPRLKPSIVAESREMRDALQSVEVVAPTSATVCINGETGVGKEIIARAIHALSKRSHHEFVAVNCGAIPSNLIESALFGHEKGAFTGACGVHQGFFERAEHGTLFLDEIDSLPLLAQAKLLRVLQEGEFERVGGRKVLLSDVRVIAASSRQLSRMVADGEFRGDLFYRLNVVPIVIPPLRERREDVLELARLVLRRLSDRYQQPRKVLSEQSWVKVMRYTWPGNVRELENVLERAFLFARGPVIEDIDVPVPGVDDLDDPGLGRDSDLRTQSRRAARETETRILKAALFRHSGNVSAVARDIGITARAVHQKLKAFGIDPGPYRSKDRGMAGQH